MKKVVRKALLTAKAYRPGKGDGGGAGKEKKLIHQEVGLSIYKQYGDTYIAEMNGQKVGEMNLSSRAPYASSVEIHPNFRRQGIASKLYDIAEKDIGRKMMPSPLGLSEAATAMWKNRLSSYDDPKQKADLIREAVGVGRGAGIGKSAEKRMMPFGFNPDDDTVNGYDAGGRTGYADGGATGKLPERVVNFKNFYSRGAEAARQLSQKKGSPQQMRAMLVKAGVKPEEFTQSGFDEAFSGKPSVTSEEIFRHFHHKRPDVRATQLLSREHDDYDPDTTYETQFDEFTLHGLQNYREHLLKLPEGNNNFEESRHWPGQKNVVAHIRMGDRRTPADLAASRDAIEKMRTDPNLTRSIGEEPANWGSGAADLAVSRGTITKEEAQNLSRIKRWRNAVMEGYKPERVLHVEEIQSDWGQAGRKHGFQDLSADGPSDPNKPPQGPFVNSTPGWTNLALKHVLTEAVKGGYNKLVISPGQANADMYGLDEGRENGMKSFYDQIVPTQLNKLAKGLDPDHPGVQMFSHTLPPQTVGSDEEGYKGHALEITDGMRDAVKKGLPMYKRGGMAPISNLMVGKAMALARNLTRR
jgi:GNAT superfamily N-acetyltransferase